MLTTTKSSVLFLFCGLVRAWIRPRAGYCLLSLSSLDAKTRQMVHGFFRRGRRPSHRCGLGGVYSRKLGVRFPGRLCMQDGWAKLDQLNKIQEADSLTEPNPIPSPATRDRTARPASRLERRPFTTGPSFVFRFQPSVPAPASTERSLQAGDGPATSPACCSTCPVPFRRGPGGPG